MTGVNLSCIANKIQSSIGRKKCSINYIKAIKIINHLVVLRNTNRQYLLKIKS